MQAGTLTPANVPVQVTFLTGRYKLQYMTKIDQVDTFAWFVLQVSKVPILQMYYFVLMIEERSS